MFPLDRPAFSEGAHSLSLTVLVVHPQGWVPGSFSPHLREESQERVSLPPDVETKR